MSRFQRYISWSNKPDGIHLKVPFNTAFNSKQKEQNLGGLWSSEKKFWTFPTKNSEALKDLLFTVFGDDAHLRYDQCDLRVDVVRSNPLIGDATRSAIYFLGYEIAKASSNRSDVNLLHGLTVTAGGFTSGGSIKDWKTCVSKNTSFIIKSVSYPLWLEVCDSYRQVIQDGLITMHLLERYTDRPGYERESFHEEEQEHLSIYDVTKSNEVSYDSDIPYSGTESLDELYALRERLFEQLAAVTFKIKKLEDSGA